MKNAHRPTIKTLLTIGGAILVTTAILIWLHKDIQHMSTEYTTERYYVTAATVVDVDYKGDYITAINHSRTFYIDSIDDWQVGDTVAVMLDSHNTDTVTDDSIVQVQYVRMDREEYGVWIINTTR